MELVTLWKSKPEKLQGKIAFKWSLSSHVSKSLYSSPSLTFMNLMC